MPVVVLCWQKIVKSIRNRLGVRNCTTLWIGKFSLRVTPLIAPNDTVYCFPCLPQIIFCWLKFLIIIFLFWFSYQIIQFISVGFEIIKSFFTWFLNIPFVQFILLCLYFLVSLCLSTETLAQSYFYACIFS